MINLLPNETKKQIRAARANSIVLKCLLVAIIAVAILAGACATTYYLISQNNSDNNTQTGTISQSEIDNQYSAALAKVTSIDNDMQKTKNVLDGQIKYSEIILAIATNLPAGLTLDSISLKHSDINSGTSIQMDAHGSKSFNASTLSDDPGFENNNPELFSEYRLISKEQNANDGTSTIKFSLKINYTRGQN